MSATRVFPFIYIWFSFQLTLGLRRIHNGLEVHTEHPYTVYLIKAPPSERQYKGWTCGGAIVSSEYIITSAACVEDVRHLYAVAGYQKFVDADDLETDKCTKVLKKKVVFTCVPKAYELEYTKIEKWAITDIALVKVESPYDFNDQEYKTFCSYIPAIIPINYELKYQEPGTDCIVLGWGHKEIWRSLHDTRSYNSKELHYASTEILNKPACKKEYQAPNQTESNDALLAIIDKYMICTDKVGNINEKGELLLKSPPVLEGCITKTEKLSGAGGVTCEETNEEEEIYEENPEEQVVVEEDGPVEEDEITTTHGPPLENDGIPDRIPKKENPPDESSIQIPLEPDIINESEDEYIELDEGNGEIVVIDKRKKNIIPNFKISSFTRRNGICQNDHGGPLVTWVGGHKVLLGVASVFKITGDLKCTGPYLFTSTQCNGKFLDCILNPDEASPDPTTKALRLRRKCLGSPEERGFDMIERRISWIDHPAGAAENEIYEQRPQIPISQYHNIQK